MRSRKAGVCAALVALSGLARADVTYTFQFRAIEASTSVNNNVQLATAPNFGPFVENLILEEPFVTSNGGTAVNAARVGIDCQLDPNAVRVLGSLAGAGGLSVVGGTPTLQFGEAAAEVESIFIVDTPMPFRMTASPRPSTDPGDRYQIKLQNLDTGAILIEIDQTMPPQTVDLRSVLAPARYRIEFETEMTFDGPEALMNFYFNLRLGECYANCDESTATPELTANDFMCFMNKFVNGSPYANCDGSTGTPALTANDFLCFMSKFVAGCP